MVKTSKRIAKEDRWNRKLWAEGAREQVLTPHIEAYADALERGHRAERDYRQKVYNEFHACIDWRLEDHEQPPTPLAEYDPEAQLAVEQLSEEEQVRKREKIKDVNEVSVV